MKYRESEEMYLETILLLKKEMKKVRSIDIANTLNYSRASVSRAINLLKERGFITVSSGLIEFTDDGEKRAKDIYERHEIITGVLHKMGVPVEVAEDNACRIEHVIEGELLVYFKKFIEE
jgi:Mn-dependent DtxR family transcriptional regulator